MRHWTRFAPAHDCIAIPCKYGEPHCLEKGGIEGHGIGAVAAVWYVAAEAPHSPIMPDGRRLEGVVQFKIFTGWYLDETYTRFEKGPLPLRSSAVGVPMAADLGYHSPYPMYSSHEPMEGSCDLTGAGSCYYDGSSVNAERPWKSCAKKETSPSGNTSTTTGTEPSRRHPNCESR